MRKGNVQVKFHFIIHIIQTWEPMACVFSLALGPDLLVTLDVIVPTKKINRLDRFGFVRQY